MASGGDPDITVPKTLCASSEKKLTKLTMEGYNHKFVNAIDDFDVECVFCAMVLRDAMQLSTCGHTFCGSCWTDWTGSHKDGTTVHCPIDDAPVDLTRVFEDRSKDRLIGGLRVHCENVGCDVTPELRYLQDHLTECLYRMVSCDRGCGQQVLLWCLTDHLGIHCPRRMVDCGVCGASMLALELMDHGDTCPMKLVTCQYCHTEAIPQKELPHHHQTNCPKFSTFCSFALVGCTEKVERDGLAGHHSTKAMDHLGMLKAAQLYNATGVMAGSEVTGESGVTEGSGVIPGSGVTNGSGDNAESEVAVGSKINVESGLASGSEADNSLYELHPILWGRVRGDGAGLGGYVGESEGVREAALREKIEKMEAWKVDAETEIKRLENEYMRLVNATEESERYENDMKIKTDAMGEDVQGLKRDCMQNNGQFAIEMEQLKKENGVLIKKMEESKQNENDINKNIEELKRNEKDMKIKMDAMSKDNEAMKTDNEAMKTDNEAMKTDSEAMKKDSEAMKTDNEAMKKSWMEMKVNVDDIIRGKVVAVDDVAGFAVKELEAVGAPDNRCPCRWTVDLKHKNDKNSPRFYTRSGYRMAFHVYYGRYGLWQIEASLCDGRNDDHLPWPWNGDEEMTITSAQGRRLLGICDMQANGARRVQRHGTATFALFKKELRGIDDKTIRILMMRK